MKLLFTGRRPPLPRGINSSIKDIITRGWGFDAAARPSFEEIWRTLRQIRFWVPPNAEVEQVEEFVATVRRSEAQ
jgi:hypothetical protein